VRTGHRARHPRVGLLEAREAIDTARHKRTRSTEGGKCTLELADTCSVKSPAAYRLYFHSAQLYTSADYRPLVERLPIANRLLDDRTYMAPSDSAGVAIRSSPMAFVATCRNSRPAAITRISPSSFDR
jgi:hypothetical protein